MIPDGAKIIVQRTLGMGSPGQPRWQRSRYPLPPPSTGIIELAGNSRQNPHDKGVRYHNLESKGLRSGRLRLRRTVTASTMIARLRGCAQGQMSQWVWKVGGTLRLRSGQAAGATPCSGSAGCEKLVTQTYDGKANTFREDLGRASGGATRRAFADRLHRSASGA